MLENLLGWTQKVRLDWLLSICVVAALFPIAVGYAVAFFCLLVVLGHRRGVGCLHPNVATALKCMDWGVMWFLLCMAVAGFLAPVGSSYASLDSVLIEELVRHCIKYGLLWWTLSRVGLLAFSKGAVVSEVFARINLVLFAYAGYIMAQRLFGIDWVHGFGATLGEHRFAYGTFRPSGFMGHPLTLAYNLSFLTTFLAVAILSRRFAAGAVVSLTMLAAMLFASASRWPLVITVLVVVAFYALGTSGRQKLALVWSLGMAGLLVWWEGSLLGRFSEVFASLSDSSRFPRLGYWSVHWEIFKDHQLFGAGPSGVDVARLDYYAAAGYNQGVRKAHNMYLETLAQTGVIGFVGLCGLVYSALKSAACFIKTPPVAKAFLALVMLLLLGGLLQNTIYDSEFVYCLWLVLSLVLVVAQEELFGSLKTPGNYKSRTGPENSSSDLRESPTSSR